jgi:hypothetical protein
MRSSCGDSLAAFALVLGVALPCCAQAPPGPATLENLVNSPEAQGTPAVPEAADSGPRRPAGTVARPEGGVQHPDLEKAWAEYDAVVAKTAEGIKAAISKQFDAATAKGDLDRAEKWQAISEKFEKSGELPTETETKAAVSAAVADYKKAREGLTDAYEAAVKALTMEKKIAEAKAARNEWRVLSQASDERHERKPSPSPTDAATVKKMQTQLVGGAGGLNFNEDIPENAVVAGIAIYSAGWIDAIQVIYRLPSGQLRYGAKHGGDGGRKQPDVFELRPGEKITGLTVKFGGYVDSIRLHTNKRVSQPLGGQGGTRELSVKIPEGKKMIGIEGRSGRYLDAIGLRFVDED